MYKITNEYKLKYKNLNTMLLYIILYMSVAITLLKYT